MPQLFLIITTIVKRVKKQRKEVLTEQTTSHPPLLCATIMSPVDNDSSPRAAADRFSYSMQILIFGSLS